MANQWNFSLWGKHPSATDYLAIGENLNSIEPVCRWIRSGYEQLRQSKRNHVRSFWLFWILPEKSTRMVCGLLGLSRDGIGRPYPLLVAGVGAMPRQIPIWENISLACRVTWRKMKYLVDQTELHRTDLEDVLSEMPCPKWVGEEESGIPMKCKEQKNHYMEGIRTKLQQGLADRCVEIDLLDNALSRWEQSLLWQQVCREEIQVAPYSLFLGDETEQMKLFYRPLVVNDFVQLLSSDK